VDRIKDREAEVILNLLGKRHPRLQGDKEILEVRSKHKEQRRKQHLKTLADLTEIDNHEPIFSTLRTD
jgi:3-dehydroquinate dehydratase